jgi:tetratricopeptide (TPR) repeat protein
MKYVLCKKCKGYYVLQKGESKDDFGNCRCGGKLEYVETHSENLDKNQDQGDGGTGKIRGGYLLCNSCHGYYLLQKGETVEDFLRCRCGGELEYIKTHDEIIKKFSPLEKDPEKDYEQLNNQGLTFYHKKKYSHAIKLYDQALKIHPDFPEALNNKGNAIIQMIKNKKSMDRIKGYKKALSCYNKALEIQPSNLDILNNKGLALAYLGDYENSYKIFEEAVKINPQDLGTKIKRKKVSQIIIEDYTSKGYEKLKNGNYNEAIKYFNKLLEIKPDDIDALMYKGGALFATRNYEEAIKCFDVVIYIKKDHSIAWFSKGEALERLNGYDKAAKCYEKTVEISSKRRGNLKAENISPVLNMDLITDALEHIKKLNRL